MLEPLHSPCILIALNLIAFVVFVPSEVSFQCPSRSLESHVFALISHAVVLSRALPNPHHRPNDQDPVSPRPQNCPALVASEID
jgi:hypothetical protein